MDRSDPAEIYGPDDLAERAKREGARILSCEADVCMGAVLDLPLLAIASTRGNPSNVDVAGAKSWWANPEERSSCWLNDTGSRADGAANMASWAAGEAGFEAADAALQTRGGYGYTRNAEIYTAHQIARLLRSAPVNAESALNANGEEVLGLPRSY